MTDERVPVILDTGGPREPGYLLEVAEAFAEAARVMNHVTLSREALEYPPQADTLIRYLSSAVSRLPQLLSQVGGWLRAELGAGRIEATGGEYAGRPDAAVVAALMRLDEASALATALGEALDGAARHTGCMGVPGDGSEEGDGGG